MQQARGALEGSTASHARERELWQQRVRCVACLNVQERALHDELRSVHTRVASVAAQLEPAPRTAVMDALGGVPSPAFLVCQTCSRSNMQPQLQAQPPAFEELQRALAAALEDAARSRAELHVKSQPVHREYVGCLLSHQHLAAAAADVTGCSRHHRHAERASCPRSQRAGDP
jgi:hypothetical protein